MKKDQTVETIYKTKEECEVAINHAIRDFENSTGMKVAYVSCIRRDLLGNVEVALKVEL